MIFNYIKCKNCNKKLDNINILKFKSIETLYGDAKRIDIISTKNIIILENKIKCKKCNYVLGFINNTHKIFLNQSIFF